MLKNYIELYHLNNILIKRINKSGYLYLILIIASLLVISLFTIIPLFTSLVQFSSITEIKEFYYFSYVILLLLDIIIFSILTSTRTIVEYKNLLIFPLSYYSFIINKIGVLLTSKRYLLYFSIGFIFALYSIIKSFSIIVTILVMIFNMVLYIIFTVILFFIFYSLESLVKIDRKNIISITVILVVIFMNIVSFGGKSILLKFPLFSNIANFYTYIFSLNIPLAITEVLYLVIYLLLSLTILYLFLINYKHFLWKLNR